MAGSGAVSPRSEEFTFPVTGGLLKLDKNSQNRELVNNKNNSVSKIKSDQEDNLYTNNKLFFLATNIL